MTVPFLPAAELKEKFACTGVFYRLHLASGRVLWCRNVLNIMDRCLGLDAHVGPVDAIAVMMNPGSSRALHTDDGGPEVTMDQLPALSALPPVPARPDTTQYQLMRLMVWAGWRRLRVVNLSDIREPKSPNLFRLLRDLDREVDGTAHSLFSDHRLVERTTLFNQHTGPIVIGWGRDRALRPLAKQCMAALAGRPILGVRLPDDPLLTAHPSPQLKRLKLDWLAAVAHQIPAIK